MIRRDHTCTHESASRTQNIHPRKRNSQRAEKQTCTVSARHTKNKPTCIAGLWSPGESLRGQKGSGFISLANQLKFLIKSTHMGAAWNQSQGPCREPGRSKMHLQFRHRFRIRKVYQWKGYQCVRRISWFWWISTQEATACIMENSKETSGKQEVRRTIC